MSQTLLTLGGHKFEEVDSCSQGTQWALFLSYRPQELKSEIEKIA